MADYKHPEIMVSTDWVAKLKGDPKVRVVEVDVNTRAYEKGHIKNAVGWNWTTQLNDHVRRDIASARQFEDLCQSSGISNNTRVILYGDNNNWFAAFAFWLFKLYRHNDVRLMNGGRKKWEQERRPLSTAIPIFAPIRYKAGPPDKTIRARREDIFRVLEKKHAYLVDVRTPDEFTGRVIAPPGMSETALRGGHIPGAANIPWSKAINRDGTFKSYKELVKLYEGRGICPDREAVTYCRIGERSSHTWLVLKYLLGYPKVRNYDGSWTEWGNLIGAPIELYQGGLTFWAQEAERRSENGLR